MRLTKSFSTVSFYNRPIFAHIVIGSIFLVLASFCTLTGFLPTLDTIEIHGAFHYFYSSIARGIIPYWNPYSQTGTPFFNEFQTFGLLLPSQFVFGLFQKITGCTTLTTYIFHFFFLYYVFVVGTYYTLQLITARSIISLTFSMILAFACFPNFMRHEVSNFFLVPFITFFSLLFFKESKVNKKGIYLFLTSFLFATSLHKHIPMWLLFYLLLFLLFALLCKIADIKATVRFLTNRHGLFWVILSIIVVLLISSPIIVLYYELHHNTEYFPSLRFLQKNGNNLIKCYASDIREELFSEGFSNFFKLSVTLGNFIGLLFEPFQDLLGLAVSSDVVLYISILPLLCIARALIRTKNQYSYLFFAIAGLVLLVSCNFGSYVLAQPTFTQRVILKIVPFLKLSDLLMHGATLFLFCSIITGAIGFQKILEEKRKFSWIIPIIFPFCKYIVFLPMVFGHQLFVYQTLLVFGAFFIAALLMSMPISPSIVNTLHHLNVKKLQYLAIAILFLDLLIFNVFHVLYVHPVLSKDYFNYLRQENLVHTKLEHNFINYRVPFSPLHPKQTFNMFVGHEMYKIEKTAFPNVVKVIRSKQSDEKYLALWDHLYMTTYYYDYLVNVQHEKQVVTSHIVSPILNFFPKENVIFLKNKYEVVEQINKASLDDLRTYIYIEQDTEAHAPALAVSQFFNPDYFIQYTKEELFSFNQNLHLQYPANAEVSLNIIDYDINHLSLIVETPYDGYVYFGDGYSKHWKAFLDSKPTKIEKTNINFKAVYTPEGKHRVDFRFDPVLFRYSLYLQLIGNMLFLTVLIIALIKCSRGEI